MSSKSKFDPSSSVDRLFREFPEAQDKHSAADNDRKPARREASPFMRAIDGLASIFERETQAVKRFNIAVERNMKALEGVRTATRAVHRYALKALEEKFSDGVYAPDGSIKSPQCLSVNGNQIKL